MHDVDGHPVLVQFLQPEPVDCDAARGAHRLERVEAALEVSVLQRVHDRLGGDVFREDAVTFFLPFPPCCRSFCRLCTAWQRRTRWAALIVAQEVVRERPATIVRLCGGVQ